MRVGRLATCDAGGQPHVVPIVFAVEGHRLYTPLDEKPKRVAVGQLKRVRNILVNPQVAVVVDEYDEDWSRLAWVLIRGTAEIVAEGEAHATAMYLLRDKYPQYAAANLERRPVIVIRPTRIAQWGFLGRPAADVT
ncbi:MAG: TIGR03668 family PPOX class F420-dependent oxidoreductase [Chloroflexi bacterium]|nr:TIGR03668 family PPOX class F420-dependent oxidoreductase [Chloroflexota bacterium]